MGTVNLTSLFTGNSPLVDYSSDDNKDTHNAYL